jgi:ribosomal protein L11
MLYLPAQNPSAMTSLNAALGQNGINSFEFVKQFNLITKQYLNDIVLTTQVNIYLDKKFDIIVKKPSSVFMIFEEVLIPHGLSTKDVNFIEKKEDNNSFLSLTSLYKIALYLKNIKMYNMIPVKSILKMLLGTAKSANINIKNDLRKI